MRTAIFLGLITIASAINKESITNENVISFIAILSMIMMAMDLAEFFHKITKKWQ